MAAEQKEYATTGAGDEGAAGVVAGRRVRAKALPRGHLAIPPPQTALPRCNAGLVLRADKVME